MLEFRTAGFNPYAVKYSPFFDSRLAVSSGANFGLVGNGRLSILNLTNQGIICEKSFDTQDCLFDTCWSEAHENQLLTAGGDGSVKLFDIGLSQFPIASWQEHGREVFSVAWNLAHKRTFLSSSWDGSVKIWDPEANNQGSVLTLPIHSCVYSAQYSPHSSDVVTAVSRDSHLRVFDLRTPASASNHLTLAVPIHAPPKVPQQGFVPTSVGPTECLTHDWNKYRSTIVATAGVDGIIRTFDLRSPGAGPIAMMQGHEYAIRKLSWSPHLSDVLLSASYDMTCRVWTDGSTMGAGVSPKLGGGSGGPREMGRMDRHTEFAMGVDWCLFGAEGWCATCAWDERVLVWDVREFMRG
ncbi:peroxisomal targeting signal 2 receptor [Zalaria obscura]|uniref:Peroxisomal targeting signal 2 receptor n=1 Tax=Zalaria obscura TaxID=2024903 RepID=A0ACC3SCJ6_9PEZI